MKPEIRVKFTISLISRTSLTIFFNTTYNYKLQVPGKMTILRGDADKFLSRPTTLCRKTESIVSLERGVCSCAELHVFSCYRGRKEACQATRAISTNWRRELSSLFFFLKCKMPKEIHVILIETLAEHVSSYATVKNRLTQFERGEFSTCVAPPPGRPKTETIPEIDDEIH